MAIGDTDYASTLEVTDVVNSSSVGSVATAVKNNGMSQGALYTLLNSIITNWNLMLVKVKADGANSTYSTYACTTMASRGLSSLGMNQDDLVAALTELETNFAAVLALLDADTQVALTTYTAVALAAGSGATLNLDDTVVGSKGLSQEAIVSFLDDFVAKFNAVLGNLDIDAL